MKLSLNWIKDYVKLPENMDLTQLAYDLTMSTVEVEGVTELAKRFDKMVVGLIDEILPHPNADKLKLCKTVIGDGDVREIVCGGINLKEGMKVAVACPGAMVRWHGEGDLVAIGLAKVRGVESYGMICASSEIGLFDLFPYEEDATILDLSMFDAQAGTALADALNLHDFILEIDNKSMTNRPDLWGHYGIAREIAALYNLPLMEIVPFKPLCTPDFQVIIDDPVRCPRYIGVQMEGLSIKPAAFEIQSRIWRVGMRPVNGIVDITNYIMLATGQPTHAFDADRIQGRIKVRRAAAGEELILLNGKKLQLSADDLVIADDVEAVALAGVMGGEKDSILPETERVILEIANFEAIGVRRTAARHETRTEAAIRYEKAIDPERSDIALSIAMRMFADLFPGITVTGYCDNYPNPLKKSETNVSMKWLEKRLGKSIPHDEITDKLIRLGFLVEWNEDNMHVVAPTWRSTGDISLPADIMEEVARMYGYENFEATEISTVFTGTINQLSIDLDRKIKEYLAFRCGMREIFTYPWMNDAYITAILPSSSDMLSLAAPPSPDEHYIRSSLLPNLCKAVSDNLRYFSEFSIFESAQIFSNRDFNTKYDARESLPDHLRNVAGAFVGGQDSTQLLFRKVKGMMEALPCYVHIEPFSFGQEQKPEWADDVVWLNIFHGTEKNQTMVGNVALLSKKASLGCGIKKSAVVIFELNIDELKPYPSRTNKFTHISEYPMTDYDISMLFDLSVKWEEIRGAILETSNDLLKDITFVDEYRGQQVPSGKKSVTIRLLIGSMSKTLTSEEIEKCANVIVKRLSKKMGAELRG